MEIVDLSVISPTYVKLERVDLMQEINREINKEIYKIRSLLNDRDRNSQLMVDSRKAEGDKRRKEMAARQDRQKEKRVRHNELQAAEKKEAAEWRKYLEGNNMTWQDHYKEMEEARLASGHVPYVDNTPRPPSEADSMQTVSYKDLYKRARSPDALSDQCPQGALWFPVSLRLYA